MDIKYHVDIPIGIQSFIKEHKIAKGQIITIVPFNDVMILWYWEL